MRRVLRSAAKAGTVKRVVLTSSIAAMCDEYENGREYNEDDWNTKSSIKRLPYYYSKVLAEKTAIEFVKGMDANQAFELVRLNPSVVLGPALDDRINTSVKIYVDYLRGRFPVILPAGVVVV